MHSPMYNGEQQMDFINNEQWLCRNVCCKGKHIQVECDSMSIRFEDEGKRAIYQEDGIPKLKELFLNSITGSNNQPVSTSNELSANQAGLTGASKQSLRGYSDGVESNQQEKLQIEVQFKFGL